jgi:thiamine biosynthesis lipoprotein
MNRASLGLALAICGGVAALTACVQMTSADGAVSSGAVAVERQAYLMGTRARLTVEATSRAGGLEILAAALRMLEATDAELSTWRHDSAISILNRTRPGRAWTATTPLCRLFDDVYRWRAATAGAFDPAIGALTAVWGVGAGGRIPSSHEILAALAQSGLGRLAFDRARCTLTRTSEVTLDVGAFGKGEALDRAATVFNTEAWMIDLGGHMSVGGSRPGGHPWTIDLADPANRERPLLAVKLHHGSISTSGGSERDRWVNGQRVGHILDPRTGQPAAFDGSVTVWHERGLVADILSTALYVMGPDTGIAWAEARGMSALFLIPGGSGVTVRATTAFERTLLAEAGS